MKFGVARDLITPDRPMQLSGYGTYYGNQFEGIHDDLYVKAVLLDDGSRPLLMLSLDLLFHDVQLTETIRQYAHDRYGIDPDHVLLNYTHTHSGPAMRGYDIGQYSDEYEEFLEARIKSCINRVFRNTFAGTASYGFIEGSWNINRRKTVDGVVYNKPNPDGITDDRLHIVKIADSSGRPRALLLNYACHPVTIRDTPYISGDFPGRICQLLEAELFGATALFFQGAGGNSRPLVTAKGGEFITCTFNEIDNMAGAMANRIRDAVSFGAFEPVRLKLAARQFQIPLELDVYPKEVFEEAARTSYFPCQRVAAGQVVERYEQMDDRLPLHAGIIRLSDDLYIASMGGEPCVETKLNVERAFAGKKLMFYGYTDSTAYIPSDKIIKEGGYEADGSVIEYGLKGKFKPGIDRSILTAFEEQLRSMQEDNFPNQGNRVGIHNREPG